MAAASSHCVTACCLVFELLQLLIHFCFLMRQLSANCSNIIIIDIVDHRRHECLGGCVRAFLDPVCSFLCVCIPV